MPTMGSYCKAYPVARFQEFSSWPESARPQPADEEGEAYLFLQENLVVTDGIFKDENIVFDRVTPEWEKFCVEALQFSIPSDILQADVKQAEGAADSLRWRKQ